MNSVALWMREARVPFFTAASIPVLLGSAAAWYETGTFHPGLFLVTLLGAVLAQAGANMANDYYDTLSGNDEINRFRSPFNGGTGVIQEGRLSARQVHVAALTALAVAFALGVYLATVRGPVVIVLALLGGIAAYFYTANPLHLAYYGLGELLIGASFGPLLVAGAYLVQAGSVSPQAIAASVPVALLITAVLYINQFPDYEADKAVGKRHWVVRLGTGRAVAGLAGLLVATHLTVLALVATRVLPWPALATLLTVPLTVKTLRLAAAHHAHPVELRPANAAVIANHLFTGLLLTGAFIAAALLGV